MLCFSFFFGVVLMICLVLLSCGCLFVFIWNWVVSMWLLFFMKICRVLFMICVLIFLRNV